MNPATDSGSIPVDRTQDHPRRKDRLRTGPRRAPRCTRPATWALTICCILGAPAGAGTHDAKTHADNELRAFHSGNGLLNRGLYELAIKEYQEFLSAHGDHEKAPIARYGLAVSLFRLDRHEEAVAELDRLNATPDFPYAAEVGTLLGQCHLTRQEYGPAVTAFEGVVTRFSEHDLADDAAAGWVEALYLDGRHKDAIRQCDRFASQWPDSPLRDRVDFFGGLAEVAAADYARAATRFARSIEHRPDGPFADRVQLLLAQCHHLLGAQDAAMQAYRDVLEQGARDHVPDALLGLATLLLDRGTTDEAAALLDRLFTEYPESPLRHVAKLHRARAWFQENQFDRAFALFESAGEGDPALADQCDYWMAKCTLRQERHAEVAERLARAIQNHPDSRLLPEMSYDRGVALFRAGEMEAAAGALATYLDRFPQHELAADALHLLAVTEHRRQRYEPSLDHCEDFARRFASHALAPAVAFLAGENEFLMRRYDDAAKRFKSFLERYPDAPQAPEVRFRWGTTLYRLGRLDEAEPLLIQSVKGMGTEGPFASALSALGDIYFQRGEWKDAERYLEDYLATGHTTGDAALPAADDALLKLGLTRQRQGQYEPAVAAYDELLARHNDSPHRLQAIFEKGQSLVALDRLADAAEAFREVLAQGADSRFAPHARRHLGAIAIQQGQFDEAADYFDQAAAAMTGTDNDADVLFQQGEARMGGQRYAQAEQVFRQFLDRHPKDARAPTIRAQLAIALSRQDRFADALKVIGEAHLCGTGFQPVGSQVADPCHVIDRALRTAVQYEQAWCLRKLGHTEQAAEVYRAVLAADPPSVTAVHAALDLAAIESDAGRYEPAAKLLRPLCIDPHKADVDVPPAVREQALYCLAVCESRLGGSADAAELFETLLGEFPDSSLAASASYLCGEAWFQTGRHERAAPHFARVAERFRSDPAYPMSLLRLGECQAVLQRWADSEKTFNEYLDRFGNEEPWFQAMFGVGWARENQGAYHDAVTAYRKVIEGHQGVTAARAQFQIGECLFATGDYADAVRELLKVDIHYAYPEWSAAALFEAGRCFEKLGQPVQARDQFRQVAERYADTRWAKLADERLAIVASGGIPGR